MCYNEIIMIKSFKHKGLEKLFLTGSISGINPDHVKRLKLILAVIHRAKVISDINFIGSNLHELKGERQGIWSVTVRANWRITFRFEGGDAYILNYEDYH
jgi:proteic killer suppression protein